MPREHDRALWYAKRLRDSHSLPFPARMDALLAVCEILGVTVTLSPGLSKGGQFWSGPNPLIVIQRPCPFLLSHELLHALAVEREPEYGICEEAACHRFAWLLCSGKPEAATLLGIAMDRGPAPTRHEKLSPGPSLGTKAMDMGTAVTYAWTDRAPLVIETQIRACRWYARQQGLSLGPAFVDHCTAFVPTDQRPEAARLLQQAQTLRASGVVAVLVANRSRLAPCRALCAPFVASLEAAGLTLQSADAGQWSAPWR